jgi:hypothetical protein
MNTLLSSELILWKKLKCQIGSDFHFSLDQGIDSIIQQLKKEKKSEVLFFLWDVFETRNGEDSSSEINNLISEISEMFQHIIFTPGNHDLRWRVDPWESFSLPKNVYYPESTFDTKVCQIEWNKILVANLFYDMEFINSDLIGGNQDEIREFYKKTNDGKHFLYGDISLFKSMTEVCKKALDSQIDIVATHSLPHPSLTIFRARPNDWSIDSPGIMTVTDMEDHKKHVFNKDFDIDRFIKYWNLKSFFMGSNILEGKENDIKDGLVCLYGHNHRGWKSSLDIGDKKVHFVSAPQPNFWGKIME